MATRDMASGKKITQHLAAAAYTTTQTPSTGVDTQGFDAVTFLIAIGVVSNIANSPQPSWTFKLEESDTSNASFVAITDSTRVLVNGIASPGTAPNSSTGVFLTIDDAAEDAATYHVGVITDKRYVRVVATAAATPGSTPMCIVAVLERGALEPVSN
ncbi:MAG: hypothetical protein WD270_01735 [Acetobacterales bacterium]